MNIKIIIGVVVSVIVIGGGALFVAMNNQSLKNNSACVDICKNASQVCPSLINEAVCNNKCSKLSEEAKKHLQESVSCEQITSKPDLIVDLIIPEGENPKPIDKNASECEAACGSYVGKCLTLVPNATPALFEEGQSSCEKECANWNTDKVNCMIGAFDCEAMTNICGL